MGTVNILECARQFSCVRSFLNVTTDKVYENKEWEWGYREEDVLDGFDPYSNSKSCSELVTHSYKQSFFTDGRCAVSTCRAGNVIGGGDFAADDRAGLRACSGKERADYRAESAFDAPVPACVRAAVFVSDGGKGAVGKVRSWRAATTSDRMTVTASIQDVWRICL